MTAGAAWVYHDATKHSPQSVRSSRHFLDWDNLPRPFKVYTELDPIPLPRELDTSSARALDVLLGDRAAPPQRGLDLATIAHLLHFSAGILRKRAYPGGESYFRAAACTGNLHHIDLYLICGDLPELAAGVYHFGPHDHALRRLRSGDHLAALVRATGNEPHAAAAPAMLAFATTFWRNSWKYEARAYRHAFWDSGTLLANLLAVAAARGVAAHLILGFVDAELNHLLGLDTAKEAALGLVALGGAKESPKTAPRPSSAESRVPATISVSGGEQNGAPASAPSTASEERAEEAQPALHLATLPLSLKEVDYPEIRAAHAAAALRDGEEAAHWRVTAVSSPTEAPAKDEGDAGAVGESVVTLPPPLVTSPEPIEAVILRRGSARVFAHDPIDLDQLATILRAASQDLDADFIPPQTHHAGIYLIVNAACGIDPGAYFFEAERNALVMLRRGSLRRDAGMLGLWQDIPHDAAACLFWLTDLHPVLDALGSRGYRTALLEAAIAGGRTYLAAYALRLGASGLTFFDDEVTRFFSPHAAGKSVMFLMAVGKVARRTA